MRLIPFIVLLVFSSNSFANPYCAAAIAFENKDFELAEQLMLPLAKQGQAEAQANLALYFWGRGENLFADNEGKLTLEIFEQRISIEAQGTQWLEKAALQGRHEFQRMMAWAYERGIGTPQQEFESIKSKSKQSTIKSLLAESIEAQEMGDTDRASRRRYSMSQHQMADEDKMLEWYEIAANQDDEESQLYLARYFEIQSQWPWYEDPKKSLYWWHIVAEKGERYTQDAKLKLARNYSKLGEASEAIKWYLELISQKGWAKELAIWDLAKMYQDGDGIPQNDYEAARLFGQLADMGSKRAHYELGILLSELSALTKDNVMAYSHFSMADALGSRKSKEKLSLLSKIMTSDQLAEGQSLAQKMWSKLKAAGGPKLKYGVQFSDHLTQKIDFALGAAIFTLLVSHIPAGVTCP